MAQTGVNPMHFVIQISLIFLIFYFLLIRPQKAKQAEHKKMLSELKKNDAVITAGGMHGIIVNVKENTVVVRVDDNVKVEIQKDSVSSVKKSQPQT